MIDRNTKLRGKDADRQFQRAVAGQENIYAFQENLAANARKRQLEAEQKAQKKEEAIRLTNVYFTALQARLAEAVTNENLAKTTGNRASGVTAQNAGLFALKDTFLADALASTLAGAFATGVEDFQGKGTGTSDSNIIAFSNHESVVTAKGTAENRGLVTAMNDGTVDDYFSRVWMPKFDMDNSPSLITKKVSNKDNTNMLLLKEIKSLRSEAADRPVQQVHVDSFGNIIETSYRNGLNTIIKHQAKKLI
jgi:hypothetical protein